MEQFFRVLYRDSFTEKPKLRSERTLNKCTDQVDQLGYSHFAFVREEEVNGEIKKVPYEYKTARTFHTFFGYMNEPDALWYTPNTLCTSTPLASERAYRVRAGKLSETYVEPGQLSLLPWYDKSINQEGLLVKRRKGGRSERYVRWLNAFFVDIDDKTLTVDQLLHKIKLLNLPEPTVVNETRRGYHVYWFLKERVAGTPNAKKLYKHIVKNLITALSGSVKGVDSRLLDTCRYLQYPRNIKFSDYSNMFDLLLFKNWLNEYGKHNYKTMSTVKRSYKPQINYDNGEGSLLKYAIPRLLSGVKKGKRHDAAFALSCYYKHIGQDEKTTYQLLLSWNKKNENHNDSHNENAIMATVKSVYASETKGIPYKLISELTGISLGGWVKHRKPREERKKSHTKEWVKDMVIYFLNSKNKHISGSQEEIAASFDMPIATFKRLLKAIKNGNYKCLVLNVSGRGKNAVTTISLNQILYKSDRKSFFDDLFGHEDAWVYNYNHGQIAAGDEYFNLSDRGSPPF